jgi:UrcA family protein
MNATRIALRCNLRALCLATLGAAWLPLFSSPSLAADPVPGEPPPSKTVNFADLNLHSHEGLSELYQRIVAAADEVCGYRDSLPINLWSEQRACTSQSIARAVAAVGIPELTAMHLRRTGHGLIEGTVVARR